MIPNPDRLEKGQAFPGISFTVKIILITMKLCDINQSFILKSAGKIRVRIDENPHPEDSITEGGKKVTCVVRSAIAPAFGPEIDAEGGYAQSSEFIRIIPGCHSTDLQGGLVGGKKAVQKLQHGSMMKVGG